LPLFPEEKRDTAGFAALFFLLTAYLPLLKYSGASYLTGAFLAGLSFSQINTVHAAYTRSSDEIMIWLMRIFFAATIGFQVPILMFGDAQVLGWGFLFRKFAAPNLSYLYVSSHSTSTVVPAKAASWNICSSLSEGSTG
jgi:Kef-type K+ transport system membrane component KefB